jgi:hypothetical protein
MDGAAQRRCDVPVSKEQARRRVVVLMSTANLPGLVVVTVCIMHMFCLIEPSIYTLQAPPARLISSILHFVCLH